MRINYNKVEEAVEGDEVGKLDFFWNWDWLS
jgi:hypothetical protein